ncbi:hypothetical protein BV898_17284 [Hypsibius exemplaris]|uniref:Cadherin domain-containing protein n=1 Tax=Hypsibius exemplaris TaxID=2072580 RepID=A0A9X6NER6_HYPEX|nr:hypothetical protein BV898_17284 [Hypsibius exemplaris]
MHSEKVRHSLLSVSSLCSLCSLALCFLFGVSGHEFHAKANHPEGRQAYSSYVNPIPGNSYQNLSTGYSTQAAAPPTRNAYPIYAQPVYLTAGQPNYGYTVATSTVSAIACKSTTYRTNLGCYCALIGQRCIADNSICIGDLNDDGICGCVDGYVAYKYRCLTTAAYNNITANGTTTASSFAIYGPTIIASCLLPLNSVFGRLQGTGATTNVTYSLTLLSSSPLQVSGDATTKYVDVDPTTGNLLYKLVAPASLTNQLYRVTVTQPNGNFTTSNITVAYNCTAPTCAFDFGNSIIVDCLRFTVGDTVVRYLVTGSVAPTFFSMSLISSSSQTGNTFFRIDPVTGQVFLLKMPHGGAFVENYSVSATNAAGASCVAQTLTLTTTETCV